MPGITRSDFDGESGSKFVIYRAILSAGEDGKDEAAMRNVLESLDRSCGVEDGRSRARQGDRGCGTLAIPLGFKAFRAQREYGYASAWRAGLLVFCEFQFRRLTVSWVLPSFTEFEWRWSRSSVG